jgi:hypothetical protein
MVKRGGLSIHLQKAPKLSKEWGEGQLRRLVALPPSSDLNNGANRISIPISAQKYVPSINCNN